MTRLNPYNDLFMIGKYAKAFGQDPDREVFGTVSFNTITAFMTMWKETDEYDERFSYIWNELNSPTTK